MVRIFNSVFGVESLVGVVKSRDLLGSVSLRIHEVSTKPQAALEDTFQWSRKLQE